MVEEGDIGALLLSVLGAGAAGAALVSINGAVLSVGAAGMEESRLGATAPVLVSPVVIGTEGRFALSGAAVLSEVVDGGTGPMMVLVSGAAPGGGVAGSLSVEGAGEGAGVVADCCCAAMAKEGCAAVRTVPWTP
jgi:hypothetical protein